MNVVDRIFDPATQGVRAAFPALTGYGPLWFSSEVRGTDVAPGTPPEQQCEAVYAALLRRLTTVGQDASSVARLDHFVSSQEWLPVRQTIRARYFGRPAPLASSGIAIQCEPGNHLSAAFIAARPPTQREVMVGGSEFGMHAISSAVRAGPLIFISGILKSLDDLPSLSLPATLGEAVLADLRGILDRCGESLGVERADVFASDPRDAHQLLDLINAQWPGESTGRTAVRTPFDGRRAMEATLIARPSATASPFAFVHASASGATAAVALRNSLGMLAQALRSRSLDPRSVCRLDLTLPRDQPQSEPALALVAELWGSDTPAIVVRFSSEASNAPIMLDAIVARSGPGSG